jgi:hypothetical protein
MNGDLPFRTMVEISNRGDPTWKKKQRIGFDKTASKNYYHRDDRRRYRRRLRRERKVLKALDISAPLATKPTPKSRREARWIYRKILPIIYRRLFDDQDRFIWDAVEHKYYQYLNLSSLVLGRGRINRLYQCYPWRVSRLRTSDLEPGLCKSSNEPCISLIP